MMWKRGPQRQGADTEMMAPVAQPQPVDNEPASRDLSPWWQVLVGFLVNFMTWGNPNAFGVYQLYYSESTSLSSSQISWVGSIQLFLTFITGSISGRLGDAGYTRYCIFAGSSLTVLGLMMTSVSRAYWQILLSQGVCIGLGGGLMAMPSAAAIGSHLRSRRALAMCISSCGAGIGAITYASIVQYLMPSIGFAWATRCCGFVTLICAIGANIFSRPPLYATKAGGIIDWGAFKSNFFVMFCIGGFLIYFSLFASVIYINSFATAILNFPPSSSVQFILLSNAAALLARPLSGLIADRQFGEVNTWSTLCLLLSATMFAWIGVRTRETMYMYSALMGFVNGGAQSVFPSAINSLSQSTGKLGTRMGMVFSLCGVASLAGPPAMGAMIDSNGGNYLLAQVCGGTLMGVGSLIVVISRLYFSSTKGFMID